MPPTNISAVHVYTLISRNDIGARTVLPCRFAKTHSFIVMMDISMITWHLMAFILCNSATTTFLFCHSFSPTKLRTNPSRQNPYHSASILTATTISTATSTPNQKRCGDHLCGNGTSLVWKGDMRNLFGRATMINFVFCEKN